MVLMVISLLVLLMTIVNCCAIDRATHKTLLKWRIVKCEEQCTIASFFRSNLSEIFGSLTEEAAYIGRTKDVLDSTDLDIDLNEVISTFGCFLKYKVRPKAVTSTSISSSSSVSAFTIMMAAQREQCRATLPDKLEKIHLQEKRSCIMM